MLEIVLDLELSKQCRFPQRGGGGGIINLFFLFVCLSVLVRQASRLGDAQNLRETNRDTQPLCLLVATTCIPTGLPVEPTCIPTGLPVEPTCIPTGLPVEPTCIPTGLPVEPTVYLPACP